MKRSFQDGAPGVLEHPPMDEPPIIGPNGEERSARIVAGVRQLWEERRFIGRVTSWGLAVGLVLAFLLPERYEATTRLMPPDNQASTSLAMIAALSNRTGGLGTIAGDFLGLKTSGALFVGVLRSQTVQDRLVERFGLKQVYWKSLNVGAREKLSENTTVAEDRKSGIITITVTDGSPQRAADIANAYVEQLNRLVTELSTSSAHRERIFIEERLRGVKMELDAAAKELSEFSSKNATIDPREQGRAIVESAASVLGQLIAAETELEGLKPIYTDSNVRIRSIQARIAELKRQVEKVGGPRAMPDKAKSSETKPADSLDAYPTLRSLPALGVTYADLYRNLKVRETVSEILTQQLELAKVQEAKETPSVKVLDAAIVPEKRSFPPRILITLLGTLLAFGFGVVWVLGTALWAEVAPDNPARELVQTVRSDLQGPLGKVNGYWNRWARRKRDIAKRDA